MRSPDALQSGLYFTHKYEAFTWTPHEPYGPEALMELLRKARGKPEPHELPTAAHARDPAYFSLNDVARRRSAAERPGRISTFARDEGNGGVVPAERPMTRWGHAMDWFD